jgi:N-acetylmuramoyl-L-alanine amidase
MRRSVLWTCIFWAFALALGSATQLMPQNAPGAEATPAPAQNPAPAPPRNVSRHRGGGVHVIAIDPGHGGPETGATNAATLEKNWALDVGRKLRTALQSRLGATVLLTRDSDVALSSEARAAVANNSQADLFVSLHAGYSANAAESGASIFLMKDNPGTAPAAGKSPLFSPWYLGYRSSQSSSMEFADSLQAQLGQGMPESKPSVRHAPIAVLASLTMPAVMLEMGNLNDPASAQTLMDPAFQTRLVEAITSVIEKFAAAHQGAPAN